MDSTTLALVSGQSLGPVTRAQRAGARAFARVFPNTVPNELCGSRIVIAPIVGSIILYGYYHGGMTPEMTGMVITVGAPIWLTDFIDGALGTLQIEWGLAKPLPHPSDEAGVAARKAEEARLTLREKFALKGRSYFGAWLDPLSDKDMFVSIGGPLSLLSDFVPWMAPAVAIEFLLTVVRPMKKWLFGRADDSANLFGKIKAQVQPWGLLVILITSQCGVPANIEYWIIRVIMSAMILSGAASLTAHLITGYIHRRR